MKIIVEEDGELLSYLYQHLELSKKKIKSYLSHGLICINHSIVTQYNYPVKKNMVILIDTRKKQQNDSLLDIIYEDSYILVVNKPSGLLTIATQKEKEKTLYHYVSMYLKNGNQNNKVFIVHRLDKDTSGIVLFAKDRITKEKLQKNWNNLVRLREYTAVVSGSMKKKQDRLVHYLNQTKTNFVYVTKKLGKEAITHYEVIKEGKENSLLRINIATGRKNQIRVQLAYIGHPIIGDKKYGKKNSHYHRLYLHANQLKLFYPMLKKEVSFTVDVPKEFGKMV